MTLDRRDAVRRLLAGRGDALVIAGLGSPAWDVAAAGDDSRNFYLWGGMGGAAMMGLGLALAQPGRRVLVITGDGEMLMGLGSLATIAMQRPANLTVVVLDNGRFGETGMQESHTAGPTRLPDVARGCGLAQVLDVATPDDVDAAARAVHGDEGPWFVRVAVAADELPRVLPERDGAVLKRRLRAALGLAEGDAPGSPS